MFIDINPFSPHPFAAPSNFINLFRLVLKIALPILAIFTYKVRKFLIVLIKENMAEPYIFIILALYFILIIMRLFTPSVLLNFK